MDIYDWLLERIARGEITDGPTLNRYKIRASKEFGGDRIIPNSELLAAVRDRVSDTEALDRLTRLLQIKRTRTISGVAPVAVMTSPAPCPHGRCICCPGGVENGTPQSYTGHEPAALRGGASDYDPYVQTAGRIAQLEAIGHSTRKIDLIVMGGTFPARDRHYREWFVKRCFDGMNRQSDGEEITPHPPGGASLEDAMLENETGPHRCIGLTMETRPDHCYEEHVDEMLRLGATRVELGVQSLDDAALSAIERGHDVKAVTRATKVLRDRGLKVCYHMMPGIPGQTLDNDLLTFRRLFEEEEFRPDMLKIYPVVVVKGCELYDMYRRGEYEPYALDDLVELLAAVKRSLPPYVRIQRIQRDIPAKLIEGGVRYSNLRQIVREKMREKGGRCGCIRCREAGHRAGKSFNFSPEEISIDSMRYSASGGEEHFITASSMDGELLFGYLRLRFIPPDVPFPRPELVAGRTAVIRELKVVGPAQELGRRDPDHFQHMHLGTRLLREAERIAAAGGMERLLVLSGIGVREYYAGKGYSRMGPYMVKVPGSGDDDREPSNR